MKHIIGSKPTPAKAEEPTVSGPVAQWRTIEEDGADQRLDNYLMRHLKGVPKTHIYRIIRSGEVRVNKGRASAETRLQLGDVVRLPPVRVSERATEKAQTMVDPAARFVPAKDFPVLFEDDYFLAINKPAGVVRSGLHHLHAYRRSHAWRRGTRCRAQRNRNHLRQAIPFN